jgi:hypothetical protein
LYTGSNGRNANNIREASNGENINKETPAITKTPEKYHQNSEDIPTVRTLARAGTLEKVWNAGIPMRLQQVPQ